MLIREAQRKKHKRIDFPVEKEIKTMDSLAKMHGQNVAETTVRFYILKTD